MLARQQVKGPHNIWVQQNEKKKNRRTDSANSLSDKAHTAPQNKLRLELCKRRNRSCQLGIREHGAERDTYCCSGDQCAAGPLACGISGHSNDDRRNGTDSSNTNWPDIISNGPKFINLGNVEDQLRRFQRQCNAKCHHERADELWPCSRGYSHAI